MITDDRKNLGVSNSWTGLWTGLLDWIAGLDSEDVRLACKTARVVDASALQGHTGVAEPWK